MSSGWELGLLLLTVCGCSVNGASHWSYKDTSQWSGYCQAGRQQSPIDLSPSVAQVTQLDKLNFANYEAPTRVNVINNGHTVDLQLEKPQACALSGGGLQGVYYLTGIHFHWGSEHTVSGRRLPLEMHLVHYSKQYSGVAEAMKYRDGLAVVGVLFKESAEPNRKLEPLAAALKAVDGDQGVKHPMTLTPSDLLPGDLTAFYRYLGSLTTPGCNESVVWTVMMATVPIAKPQLDQFLRLRSEEGAMGPNFRPPQPLNGRQVFASKPPGSAAPAYSPLTPLTIFFIPVVYVFI